MNNEPEDYRQPPTTKREADDDRVRLLIHQLDEVRAEVEFLTQQREKIIYSASWRLLGPLRFVEAKVVDIALRAYTWFCRVKPGISAPTNRVAETCDTSVEDRRILLDVTGTLKRDGGTGIQRTVKKITQAFYDSKKIPITAVAVCCRNGRLFSCHEFVALLTGKPSADPDVEIVPRPGDIFLMLSDSWNAFDELMPVFDQIRASGGIIISCVYDLIPELYPHACFEATVPLYRAWLRRSLEESDGILTISKTVAQELVDFIHAGNLPCRRGLKVGWFHCGSDFSIEQGAEPRKEIRALVSTPAPVFLCVGTLEPRKGHRTLLHAFDLLWNSGFDAKILIVGRRGWYVEALISEIEDHREFGTRLHWLDNASDSDLMFLYDHVTAVVLPSYAEGFGLPIAEAARRNCPVICSDIAVFREVGQDGAAYFRVNDPNALAETIRGWVCGSIVTDPTKVCRSSWADAADRIVKNIVENDWSEHLP